MAVCCIGFFPEDYVTNSLFWAQMVWCNLSTKYPEVHSLYTVWEPVAAHSVQSRKKFTTSWATDNTDYHVAVCLDTVCTVWWIDSAVILDREDVLSLHIFRFCNPFPPRLGCVLSSSRVFSQAVCSGISWRSKGVCLQHTVSTSQSLTALQ